MEAVKSRWDGDATLLALTGALKSGRLKKPQTAPYAHMMVEQGPRPNEYGIPATPGKPYIDYRKVTLTVFGLYADADATIDRVVTVFDWKSFTVPNATLLHCMPLESPQVEQDPDTKEGEDIWRGIAVYEFMTQRAVP